MERDSWWDDNYPGWAELLYELKTLKRIYEDIENLPTNNRYIDCTTISNLRMANSDLGKEINRLGDEIEKGPHVISRMQQMEE